MAELKTKVNDSSVNKFLDTVKDETTRQLPALKKLIRLSAKHMARTNA